MGASTHTTVGRFSFLFSGLDWLNLGFLGGEKEGEVGGLYRIDFGVSGSPNKATLGVRFCDLHLEPHTDI